MTQRPPRLAVLALGATLSLSAACGGKGGDKAAEGGSEGVIALHQPERD